MRTKKAVILAAGRGSRMQQNPAKTDNLPENARRLAEKGLKGLIPVNGRPFLDYLTERLVNAGVNHICFVISPGKPELAEYGHKASKKFDVKVDFAMQEKPLGTAHALLKSRMAVGKENFLMCNCDNLYPAGAIDKLAALPGDASAVAAFDREELLKGGNFERSRIAKFAVLCLDENGRPQQIIEKPKQPDLYTHKGKIWVSMNLFRFTPSVFEACRKTQPHPEREEMELTDAVNRMMKNPGEDFRTVLAAGAVLDLTDQNDIPRVEDALKKS